MGKSSSSASSDLTSRQKRVDALKRDRAREAARARKTLARLKPFPRWIVEQQPTPENVNLYSLVVCETIKIAALTPDEERAVRKKLGLEVDHG